MVGKCLLLSRSGVRQNGRIAVLDREATRRARAMDGPSQSLQGRSRPSMAGAALVHPARRAAEKQRTVVDRPLKLSELATIENNTRS